MSAEKGIFLFRRFAILLLFAGLSFAACSPAAGPAAGPPTPVPAGRLTPYQSPTAQASAATGMTLTPAGDQPSTPTPLPSPTPTPRTHIVKKGEDLGGIAWQYRVSVEELMAANPTVQPNMMSIGTKLVIPPSKTQTPPDGAGAGQAAGAAGAASRALTPLDAAGATPPTLTPLPVAAGKLNCTPVADGGVWCFMPVKNEGSITLEGVSGVFHIADRQAQTIVSQPAFPLLDTLPPGITLPLAAYFPPEPVAGLSQPYQYSGEIITALPSANDGRYFPVQAENPQVMLAENGLSATISADVSLKSAGKAGRVWVAAVAYDAQGNVTGVRRWEKTDARPLEYGQALAVTLSVYSVSARIDRVDLVAEARP